MNALTNEKESASIQTYARIAGVLFLLSLICGGFGEFYVPNRLIVANNAAATAHNIVAFDSLFRWGFVGYLIEGTCDIALAWIMYVLLRPVHKDVALLAAFFGLVSTAVFAVAELFFYGSTFILGGAGYLKTFSPAQVNALGLLSIKFYSSGGMIFLAFYGTATAIRGYLIYRSGYFPRLLGLLLVLSGLAFIAKNLAAVLAPRFPSDLFLVVMPFGVIAMTLWLLIKGVDVPKWEAKRAAA